MINLRAENRILLTSAKYSYLNTNYSSGVSALVVENSVDFVAADFLLLGEFGNETSEIVQIDIIAPSTNTLNLKVATKFAHSQDTKIYRLPYDKVIFYHTTTATYATTDPITGYLDVSADSLYTIGSDSTNSTGFGWFHYYNSTTTSESQASNAIPYDNFAENSVSSILKGFFSSLNDKDKKLINNTDALEWLNEGVSNATTELGLVNSTYYVDDSYALATVSGTQEYDISTNFSRIISVYDEDNEKNVDYIDIRDVSKNDYTNSGDSYNTGYYIRNNQIGFSPEPSSVVNYTIRYQYTSTALTSPYDNVDIPNNGAYIIKDFMLYRAWQKLGRSNEAANALKTFQSGMERLKVSSHKQDANLDSWGISANSNV